MDGGMIRQMDSRVMSLMEEEIDRLMDRGPTEF